MTMSADSGADATFIAYSLMAMTFVRLLIRSRTPYSESYATNRTV